MHPVFVYTLVFTLISAQTTDDKEATILDQVNVPYELKDGKGTYEFSFSTSNYINREEKGKFIPGGEDGGELIVEGSYSYVTPDNKKITVTYVADSKGYRAKIDVVQIQVLVPYVGSALLASIAGGGIG